VRPLARQLRSHQHPISLEVANMADPKDLRGLFVKKLRHVYDTEQRLTKALSRMEKAASSPDLKQAFSAHLTETETHIERLERLFGFFDEKPNADADDPIKGIISAGEDVSKLDSDAVRDAALIAAAQAAEHYEMAEYGTLRTWARILGKHEAVQLLEFTLEEEKKADLKLTDIASRLNYEAAAARAR
jgi:ferritin-like metal-binding protein YciE